MSFLSRLPLVDLVLPFQVEACGLRGRLVRLDATYTEMIEGHAYPDTVAEIVGEMAALTAALASTIKYEGYFTLQTQSDGPIPLSIVGIDSNGDMRARARFEPDRLNRASQSDGEPVPRLLGVGHLAFSLDQGPDTERYQGIVPLEGATLSACAQTYFRVSEQIETVILLGVKNSVAGALSVQRMPSQGSDQDQADEDWRRGAILAGSTRMEELLDPALPPADLLYRLYHEDGVRVFEPKSLRHRCRCSRDRVQATLRAFPRAEIEDMIEQNRLSVTCEFCKQDYVFERQQLTGLLTGA